MHLLRGLLPGVFEACLSERAPAKLNRSFKSHILEPTGICVWSARRNVTDESPSVELSQRERDVPVLIASGKTSREIAEQLGIAFKTVTVHRLHLHRKLHLHKAADLTRAAIRMGLIDPEVLGKLAQGAPHAVNFISALNFGSPEQW